MECIVIVWCVYDCCDFDFVVGLFVCLVDVELGCSLLCYYLQICFEWNNFSVFIECVCLFYVDVDGFVLDVCVQVVQCIVV